MPLSKHTVAETPGDYQDGGARARGREGELGWGTPRGERPPHLPTVLALPQWTTTFTICNRVLASPVCTDITVVFDTYFLILNVSNLTLIFFSCLFWGWNLMFCLCNLVA